MTVKSMMNAESIRYLREQGRHEDARNLAVQLTEDFPTDAELQYEAACVHDYLGLEAKAVPYYLNAISGELSETLLRGAYLGLGSTYRALGEYELALNTFDEGLAQFPEAHELHVFKAMALFNVGEPRQSVETLLKVIAATSQDPYVQEYRRAIALYSEDLTRTWRE
ncbi:tetratricopeptide repeat protein [Hahella sp. HN01]|uniref:tetratricopeptide repeat protein n=1 Tax=unclassified Hahella TaxID=2624107 RepID=UPI001C1F1D01|nr:tetratricopeptide repeat protein [Hahella sp. HN01]